MLMPRKVKHRKTHRGRMMGRSKGGTAVNFGDYGLQAYGNTMGGHFEDSNGSGYARVGYGDFGIQGYGNVAGGRFVCSPCSRSANALSPPALLTQQAGGCARMLMRRCF